LGEPIAELSKLRAEYIGSERTKQMELEALPGGPQATIEQLNKLDRKKAAILQKYFLDMKMVLSEMYRILRKDAAAIVVVGTSIMRGMDDNTHQCLADIAAMVGFDVVGVIQRTLDRNKRMMPARFGKKTASMIEQRMHEEYIIGLWKPRKVRKALSSGLLVRKG
jgi:hypothetical protein